MYVPEYKPNDVISKRVLAQFLVLFLIAAALVTLTPSSPSFSSYVQVANILAASQAQSPIQDSYGQLPLSFEANQGQVAGEVAYLARSNGYTVYLTGGEAVMVLNKPMTGETKGAASMIRLQLAGANQNLQAMGEGELPGRVNYLIGNDPEQWQTDVPTYSKVHYEDVYPGIDLVYYGTQRQLEYDFVVQPGADPGLISLSFDGVDDVRVDTTGNLVLSVGDEQVVQQAPVIYQEVEDERVEISGHYVLNSQNEVVFSLGEYNKTLPLVIDPILVYATYLGGGDSDTNFGLDVDANGNAYLTGRTYSLDFPTITDAFDPSLDGSRDIYVVKLDSTGSNLIFATYIGGTSDENGFALDVDNSGNVYVTGGTRSTDFPVTAGAFDTTRNSTNDSFALKLDASGSSLQYATYLGGGNNDDGFAIMADNLGQAYVVGFTFSSDFPTTAGAHDTAFNTTTCTFGSLTNNCRDVFAVKLDATGSFLQYGTYIGGSGDDFTYRADLDASGNIYVMGMTDSSDFPTTGTAFDTTYNGGGTDAFVAKLDSTGSSLLYATYLGGTGLESSSPVIGGIAVDNSGNAYVTGLTYSTDFPVTGGSYDTTHSGQQEPFVAKLNTSGSALIYSTFIGGSANDYGAAIAVDAAGNAYVTGQTSSGDLPITSDAFQPVANSHDAYLIVLNDSGSAITYGSYLGGTDTEVGGSIVVDAGRNVFIAGATRSSNFPATSNAFSQSYGGGYEDGFLAKIHLPCTVTNLNDAGAGSLAAAVVCANNNPGPDTITFQVAGTINQTFQLPTLTDTTGGTLIDGTTAPGYSGAPVIVLDGPGTGSFVRGLRITSADNEVRALQIQDFSWGILLEGATASGNKITRSYLGNNGTSAADTTIGVYIDGAPNNIIGTDGDGIDDSLEGNVIGGNSSRGISITGTGATGTVIAGNNIGVDAAGTAALPNMGQAGVILLFGADDTRIGTNGDGVSDVEERNIISGNPGAGVYVSGPSGTIIAGNYIGTDVSGTTAVGNATFNNVFTAGIYLGGDDARIGTNGDGVSDTIERNVISGNNFRGITLNGADNVLIAGNYIGTDVTGTTALPNETGVLGLSGTYLTLGTNGDGSGDAVEGNLISGNNLGGVSLQSGVTGVIAGNVIGLDASGTAVLANDGSGLSFSGADKLVGTNSDGVSDAAERNTISGNTANGINATSATNVVIAGNFIGTDITGSVPLGNLQWGMQINGDVRLGTNADGVNDAAERNVISGNGSTFSFVSAVLVSGSGATVSGNYIGTDATGTVAMGNNGDGIRISSGSNHIIGGSAFGAGNIIANSGAAGIAIPSSTSSNNLVLGNDIYNNAGLGIDLGTGGVTTNDINDSDSGANNLQNFPVITSVINDASGLTVTGTLNSVPNSTFTLQFFSNTSCDPSGFGEGELVIGTINVATDASGDALFSVTFPPATPGDNMTATATDVNNNTSEFSACLATTVPNQPPTADDDNYSVNEDGNLNELAPGVLAGDFDADGDPLTAVLDTTTSSGSLTLNSDGSFDYTPDANFCGSDSFTYHANDGTEDSNIATATIDVVCVDDPPTAADDMATATEDDLAFTIDVLANDTDSDGGPKSIISVTQPANGTVAITNGGADLTYEPNTNYCNDAIPTDDFTYTLTPGGSTATVQVTVICINDVPAAANDNYATDEDTTLNVTVPGVLDGDTDADGDPLTALLDTTTSSGSLTLNGDGSFDYTPTADFCGSDSFTYHANDSTIDSNVATVTINVACVNDAPIADDDNYSTNEDAALIEPPPGVLTGDTDIEGDVLTAALDTTTGNGMLTLNSDGSFVYSPDTDFCGQDSFTYHANDGQANSNIATVTIDVACVNDPPVAANNSYSTNEDTALNEPAPGVLSGDIDIEGDTLTAVLDTTTGSGSLVLNGDGSFDYTPTADYCGPDSFTYHANDGAADSNVATVTIDVVCVNDAPVAYNDDYSIAEDTVLSVSAPGVLDGDTDADGDPLTAVPGTSTTYGNLMLNADGSITYTPNPDFCGTDSFTYYANDGNVHSNDATVEIEVVCVNDAPVADNDNYSTNEDTILNEPAPGVLDNDSDVEGDALTAVLDTTTGNGSLTLNSDGSFAYTPNTNYCGQDSFTYHAYDGAADSNVATVTIDVTCVNDPPEVTVNQPEVEVDEGQTAVNSGSFNDVDDTTVNLSASTGTVVDNGNGTWSWSFATSDGPAESQVVTITADDGQNVNQVTFSLTVNNVAPSVDSITVPLSPVNMNDQSSFSVDVTFSDPANAADEFYTCKFDLNYDGLTFDADVTVNNITGTSCNASLNFVEPGVYTVKVVVTDKDGGSGMATADGFIVIYDPDGGFVTGGGWIWSEAGWCQLDAICAGAEGKANFGFVSKYKKGASVPSGNTEFNFFAGNLNFHSDSYEWLVINQGGANAQYKGSGTINGDLAPSGELYKFLLWATDGNNKNPTGDDTFRIKIWYEDNGNEIVVYDNGYDQSIGGGSIKIHDGN